MLKKAAANAAANGRKEPVSPAAPALFTRNELVELILFFVVMLAACIITVGRIAIIVALLCLVFSIRKGVFSRLHGHFTLPAAGMVLLFLVYGAAALYAPYGPSAVTELFRALCAFSLAGYALLHFEKKHVPALLWGFVAVSAAIALFSVDAASTTLLFTPVRMLAEAFGADLSSFSHSANQRLAGLFNNSNVLASLTALAMLLGLHQIRSSETRKARFLAAFLLGINAIAFFLSLSRGAILCFGISLLVFLLLTEKGHRLALFLLMFFSALVTIILSFPSAKTLGATGIRSTIPLLCALVCGPIIFLVQEFFISHFIDSLDDLKKDFKPLLKVSAAMWIVLIGLYLYAAFSMTYAYNFTYGGALYRSVKLEPGTYTYEADMDPGVVFSVRTMDKDKMALDQWETAYISTGNTDSFVIPEGTGKILVTISGPSETAIRSLVFSDGTDVKLDYPFLPDVITSRLHDNLFTSVSFLLRVEYLKDALKIWAGAPLFGRGLGGTESYFTSVQSFFYESKFAHNHILQYMADTGLAGTLCFLSMVVGMAILLIRKWRKDRDPLAATFLTCLTMMNLHGLMEISFSLRAYLICSFFLMAVMIIAYGEPLLLKKHAAVKKTSTAVTVCFLAVLTVITGICIGYRAVLHHSVKFQTTSYEELMDTLDTYISLDALDDSYYKSMYVANGTGVPGYHEKAARYALALRRKGVYPDCEAAAAYYYLPMGQYGEVFQCIEEGISQRAADPAAWNAAVAFFRSGVIPAVEAVWEDAREPILRGITEFDAALTEFNTGRLQPIDLTEENLAFLDAVASVAADPDMRSEEAYALLASFSAVQAPAE